MGSCLSQHSHGHVKAYLVDVSFKHAVPTRPSSAFSHALLYRALYATGRTWHLPRSFLICGHNRNYKYAVELGILASDFVTYRILGIVDIVIDKTAESVNVVIGCLHE